MIVVKCLGGEQGYGSGCGFVRPITGQERAFIAREGSGDIEAVEGPSDCLECGSEREFRHMSAAEYEYEKYG